MNQVLIVDESAQAGEKFGPGIDQDPEMELVACVTSAPEAMKYAGGFNVAIVSGNLPEDGTYKLTRLMAEEDTCAQVIILSASKSKGAILRWMEAGALACTMNTAPLEEVLHLIRSVSRGEAVVSPDLAGALISRLAKLSSWVEAFSPDPAGYVILTRREREVLYLISQDFSNQDIANHLIIELGTVKNHVHNILEKLKVNNRHEAASYAMMLRSTPNLFQPATVAIRPESYAIYR